MGKGFIGFLIFMIAGGIFAQYVVAGLQSASVVSAINEVSPWLAGNSQVLAWVAGAVLIIAIIAMPLLMRDPEEMMSNVATGAIYWVQWMAIFLVIISVGYLVGLGWLIATTHGSPIAF